VNPAGDGIRGQAAGRLPAAHSRTSEETRMDIKTGALTWHGGNAAAEDWQPFAFVQDGATHTYGETVLFRTHGSAGNPLAVGLWRGPDGTTPTYTSEAGDETFLVLEGEVEIERLDTGERFTYRPGDVCSWSQGTPTRWHLRGGFKKFYVTARAQP
jgi:uncharacterized cupin superfamily protein